MCARSPTALREFTARRQAHTRSPTRVYCTQVGGSCGDGDSAPRGPGGRVPVSARRPGRAGACAFGLLGRLQLGAAPVRAISFFRLPFLACGREWNLRRWWCGVCGAPMMVESSRPGLARRMLDGRPGRTLLSWQAITWRILSLCIYCTCFSNFFLFHKKARIGRQGISGTNGMEENCLSCHVMSLAIKEEGKDGCLGNICIH